MDGWMDEEREMTVPEQNIVKCYWTAAVATWKKITLKSDATICFKQELSSRVEHRTAQHASVLFSRYR